MANVPITSLPQADTVAKTDQLIVQGSSNTQRATLAKIMADLGVVNPNTAQDDVLRLTTPDGAAAHNCMYRGKALGSSFTSAQSEAIRSGKFTDLYIGDYWTINGRNWRIGAFDYWYRCGDTDCTTHHALIVPDAHLYTTTMNPTDTTEGAYIGSQMYKTGLDEAKNIINAAFGSDHILNHREYFNNAVSNGKPSGGSWYDSTVDLMNESMVYGGRQFSSLPEGADPWSSCHNYTIDKSQLPLFRYAPWFIHAQRSSWCWLRDVVSETLFAQVHNYGGCTYYRASNVGGVRPDFGIY